MVIEPTKIKSAELELDNRSILDLDLTKIDKITDMSWHLRLRLVYDDATYIIEGDLYNTKMQINES